MGNKKIIIGLVGQMSSGKGTIAEYIEKKYNAKTYKFSSILRDVLKRLHQEISRENMQNTSTALRQALGEDLLALVISKDVSSEKSSVIVVDGIRRMADIKYLEKLDNFYLTKIEANSETRYKRLVKREENIGDKDKTYKEFLKEQNNESDAEIPIVMEEANLKLDNDEDFEYLYKQIDEIINNINNKN